MKLTIRLDIETSHRPEPPATDRPDVRETVVDALVEHADDPPRAGHVGFGGTFWEDRR